MRDFTVAKWHATTGETARPNKMPRREKDPNPRCIIVAGDVLALAPTPAGVHPPPATMRGRSRLELLYERHDRMDIESMEAAIGSAYDGIVEWYHVRHTTERFVIDLYNLSDIDRKVHIFNFRTYKKTRSVILLFSM
jgi:hypothetical protein